MGRNTIAKVPQDIATLLSLANPSLYTFRTASEGLLPPALHMVEAVRPQMTDFFGWKNPRMCQE
jgi:hypothetical protein